MRSILYDDEKYYLYKDIRVKYYNSEFRISPIKYVETYQPDHIFVEFVEEQWQEKPGGLLAIKVDWFEENVESGTCLDMFMGVYMQGILKVKDDSLFDKKHKGKTLYKYGRSRNINERCKYHRRKFSKFLVCNRLRRLYAGFVKNDEVFAEIAFKNWLEEQGFLVKTKDFASSCPTSLKKYGELILVSRKDIKMIRRKLRKLKKYY